MSVFPVASILALVKGKAILPEIIDLISSCTALGMSVPGKLKTAKILATVGKFAGLGFTIYYGAGLASFILNLTLSLLFSIGSSSLGLMDSLF